MTQRRMHRRFGGKFYKLADMTATKPEAKRIADRKRSIGQNARVTKTNRGGWPYLIWTRQARKRR